MAPQDRLTQAVVAPEVVEMVELMAGAQVEALIHIATAYTAATVDQAQFVLFGPETHVHTHQQIQVICNAALYSNS
jgi:hypothetical protein